MENIEILFIPNYGNMEIVKNILVKNNITIIKDAYHSGLGGCDTPYCYLVSSERNLLEKIIKDNHSKFSDTVWVKKIN